MIPVNRENMQYKKGKTNPLTAEKCVALSYLPSRGKLLDIGCGEGSITKKLIDYGFDAYGIDFSEEAIKRAREKGIKARISDVDKGLPFLSNTFDIIWCTDVIEHVFDPLFVMSEIHRVLKKSGLFIFTVPNDTILMNRVHALFGKTPHDYRYKNFKQVKHHSLISLSLIEYFLFESGFKIEKLCSVIKVPKISFNFTTEHKMLASLFGTGFIIQASKIEVRNEQDT